MPKRHVITPSCEKCQSRMMLCRREPHPYLDLTMELWTFECPGCGATATRTLGPGGTVAQDGDAPDHTLVRPQPHQMRLRA